jgi:hypothetical protein
LYTSKAALNKVMEHEQDVTSNQLHQVLQVCVCVLCTFVLAVVVDVAATTVALITTATMLSVLFLW